MERGVPPAPPDFVPPTLCRHFCVAIFCVAIFPPPKKKKFFKKFSGGGGGQGRGRPPPGPGPGPPPLWIDIQSENITFARFAKRAVITTLPV